MGKKRLAIIGLIVSLLLMPFGVYGMSTENAKEPILTDKKCSLELIYSGEEKIFPEEEVKLYKIADISEDFQYEALSEFSDCGLNLNGIESQGEWESICYTFENYIIAEKISPYAAEKTDVKGKAKFENLDCGLYLLMPFKASQNGSKYNFSSSLISLPHLDEAGKWVYDVLSKPKGEISFYSDSDDGDVFYKVLKLWEDEGNEKKRPEEIEIEIFKNGKSERKISLSEKNNWSYSWSAEDDGSIWNVYEKNVPEGYVMKTENKSRTFVVINTFPEIPEIPENPENPEDSETPEVPEASEIPESPENPNYPEISEKSVPIEVQREDVPKTGDTTGIGVYAAIMCAAGIAFIVIGVTEKRKD